VPSLGARPEGAEIDASKVAADQELLHTRQAFGFPIDEARMRQAVDETLRRGPSPDPIGAPLTDNELDAVNRFNSTQGQRDRLTEIMRKHSDTTAAWVFNRDLTNPVATLQVTDRFPEAQIAELLSFVPSGFKAKVERVKFTTREVLGLAEQIDQDLRRKGESPSGIAQVAASLRLRPIKVAFSDEWQHVELVVDGRDEVRTDEVLTSLVAAERTDRDAPPITVRKGEEDVPVDGRTESPGQAKGGIRVSPSSCTSTASAFIGIERYILTAGHCGDTTLSHTSGAAGTTYGNTQFSANSDGTATTWAMDYEFVLLPPERRGLASNYAMAVSATTGAAWYQELTSHNVTLEGTSTYVCYEGSSQNRVTYNSLVFGSVPFRTVCAWYNARDSFGRIEIIQKVCRGDSGGPVRNGGTLYGIVSRSSTGIVGTGTPTQCAKRMQYARIAPQLQAVGAGLVPAQPAMFQNEYNKCVSANASGLGNFTTYLQWDCLYLPTGNTIPNPAQAFFLEPVVGSANSDTYRLVRYNGTTKTCASMDGNSPGSGYGDGALVIVWECIGTSHPLQNWRLQYATSAIDGRINVISEGSGRCLSVPSSDPANSLQFLVWGCISPPPHVAQRWHLR
jgi:Trypsin